MADVLLILSGCGVLDGSEIHESVSTLLHLDRHDANVTFAAPDVDQMHVVNHQTGEPVDETRNVRIESARIARGPVESLRDIRGHRFDAVILPGGFGAAKNLCDFAVKGENCEVNPEVKRLVKEFEQKQKPQAVLCIAPAMMAKIYEDSDANPTLTIGNDPDTSAKMEAMGTKHQTAAVTETVVDAPNRIVSTPAYMLGQNIGEVAEGIEKTVNQLVKMI